MKFTSELKISIALSTTIVMGLGIASTVSAFPHYSYYPSVLSLNGTKVSTPYHIISKDPFGAPKSSNTAFLPIRYTDALLQTVGITPSWDGNKLNLQVPSSVTVNGPASVPTPMTLSAGVMEIQINGKVVTYAPRIAYQDKGSTTDTTYVPVYYLQKAFSFLGVTTSWDGTTWTVTASGVTPVVGLNAVQKRRADQLISLFENGTTDIQYGYAENLDDGRGITCGRAGFTTGTGDAYEVVDRYTDRMPNNKLAIYLPELKRLLTATDKGDVSGLTGFSEAWSSLGNDPVFRAVQDQVSDRLYYNPSVVHSNELGLDLPLSRAEIYDAIIQHGDGDDPDGLQALINRTNNLMGGSPKQGIDEKKWLTEFLNVREDDLLHPYDADTQAAWSQSTGRIEVFRDIAKSGNYQLNGPLQIQTNDYDAVIQ